MDKYTIGLDYGTLSGRGILVRCMDGNVMATASINYSHGVIENQLFDSQLPPDCCLQHPQDYLDTLDYIIKELLQQSGINSKDIIGIGIDFTSCTILPVDQHSLPLCMQPEFSHEKHAYVKLWKHHSSQKQADKINELLIQLKLADTPRFGGQVSPELMVPKVLEIIEEAPNVYESCCEILEAGDWLTRMLTNSNKRSSSMAGYKAWWSGEKGGNEINKGYPSKEFFRQIDQRMANFVDDKLKGDICMIGGKIGTLCPDMANRLGLTPGIAVAPAIIDSHAGFAGSGVSEKNQMLMVLGTSSVVIVLSDKSYSEKGICGGVKDCIVPGFYALESGIASVGDLFEWFVENYVPMKYYKEADDRNLSIHELLSLKASKLKPGQSGLLALDWWNGNKTPFVDSNLSGVLIGLNLSIKPEEIYRALIESTAFGIRVIKELYEKTGIKINEIIASGGIAFKNSVLMQIYADILGTQIKIAECEQAAALGSAIYAALAASKNNGGYDEFNEAVKNMSRVKKEYYSPNAKNSMIYDKIFCVYQKLELSAGFKDSEILHDLHKLKIDALNTF